MTGRREGRVKVKVMMVVMVDEDDKCDDVIVCCE